MPAGVGPGPVPPPPLVHAAAALTRSAALAVMLFQALMDLEVI
jgi:hypothetical protein